MVIWELRSFEFASTLVSCVACNYPPFRSDQKRKEEEEIDSEKKMTKYYCDYCDVYLTHDSTSVRKSHNAGWKHAQAVKDYFEVISIPLIQIN